MIVTNSDTGLPPAQRVVLLASYAPSLIIFRAQLIEALVRRGHDVFCLAPMIDEAIRSKISKMGATAVSIQLARTGMNPFGGLLSLWALTSTLRNIRPDVVIAYTIKPVVLGAQAAKTAGIRRFIPMITGLGYAFTGGNEPKRVISRFFGTRMYKRAFRLSSLAIFQNPDDRDYFKHKGLLPPALSTYLVGGSGVDLEYYRPSPLPSEPSFLMISRFLGDKGIREYGEAARSIKAQYPNVPIKLVGFIDISPDAITEDELQEVIDGGVEYLGRMEDVRPAIADSSVYVLPSYREGTPRSVLEAMAMGRAIITTDAPGCRETVVDGVNGFLVPPRDAASLCETMIRFIQEPELANSMGEQSRRIAVDKFAATKVNSAILSHSGL